MKIVAFIEEPAMIRKILVHLDLWDVRNHDPPVKTHVHIPELIGAVTFSADECRPSI